MFELDCQESSQMRSMSLVPTWIMMWLGCWRGELESVSIVEGMLGQNTRALKSMSLSILRFYLYIQRSKNLPKCFSLMVTCYILGTKLWCFHLANFVADGKLFYSRSTLPKNFLLLFLKTVYQYILSFASISVLHKAAGLTKSVPCLVRIFER